MQIKKLLIVAFMLLLCNLTACGQPPPAEVVSSKIETHPVIRPDTEIEGLAQLPDELPLGFAVDVEGQTKVGDWRVDGRVSSIENRVISFRNSDDQAGRLVYRIPRGTELPLAVNETFVATNESTFQLGKTGYQFELTVGNQPRIVARKANWSNPPGDLKNAAAFFLTKRDPDQALRTITTAPCRFHAADRMLVHSAKTFDIHNVAFHLQDADGNNALMPGVKVADPERPFEIQFQNSRYLVHVLKSQQIQPKAIEGSMLESPSFMLEYVMIFQN